MKPSSSPDVTVAPETPNGGSVQPDGSAALLDELLDYWQDVRCRTRMPLSIYLQRDDQGGTLTGVVVRLNALLKVRDKQQNG